MVVIKFWLRDPVEDAEFNWSFDSGVNLLHVYNESLVDQMVARLVVYGAKHVEAHHPGITPGFVPLLLSTTEEEEDVEQLSLAYENPPGS